MTDSLEKHGHARRGAALGLIAAALFGVSAPLAKRLLGEMTPQVLAGLLYLGSGVGLSLWRFDVLDPIWARLNAVPHDEAAVMAIAAGEVFGGVNVDGQYWVSEGQLGVFLGQVQGPPSLPFLVRRFQG